MKISQIATGRSASQQDIAPLQGTILDELRRRSDEVFQATDEELLRVIPNLKPSALSWSLWSLCQKGYLKKIRIRLNGRLTTVFGIPAAIELLRVRLGREISGPDSVQDHGDEISQQGRDQPELKTNFSAATTEEDQKASATDRDLAASDQ